MIFPVDGKSSGLPGLFIRNQGREMAGSMILSTVPWWAQALDQLGHYAEITAQVCGGILGVYAVGRLVIRHSRRGTARRKEDRKEQP
jgi:hypothetical protein